MYLIRKIHSCEVEEMDLYYVVDVDIKGFFDNISHKLLHATNVKTIQKLLENLNLSAKQKAKLNYYRLKAGLMGI